MGLKVEKTPTWWLFASTVIWLWYIFLSWLQHTLLLPGPKAASNTGKMTKRFVRSFFMKVTVNNRQTGKSTMVMLSVATQSEIQVGPTVHHLIKIATSSLLCNDSYQQTGLLHISTECLVHAAFCGVCQRLVFKMFLVSKMFSTNIWMKLKMASNAQKCKQKRKHLFDSSNFFRT